MAALVPSLDGEAATRSADEMSVAAPAAGVERRRGLRRRPRRPTSHRERRWRTRWPDRGAPPVPDRRRSHPAAGQSAAPVPPADPPRLAGDDTDRLAVPVDLAVV